MPPIRDQDPEICIKRLLLSKPTRIQVRSCIDHTSLCLGPLSRARLMATPRAGASDAKSKAQSIDTDEAHAERLRRLEASAGATLLRLQALEEALLEEREAREAERQAAEAVRPRRGSGWLGFAARGA